MPQITWNEALLTKKAKLLGMALLRETAETIKNRIKNSMPEQGNYKSYKRPWGTHYSSMPGSRPAVDYGRLKDSISVNWSGGMYLYGEVGPNARYSDGVRKPVTTDTVVVGTNVPYAAVLENTAATKGNRPFLKPELQVARALTRSTLQGVRLPVYEK